MIAVVWVVVSCASHDKKDPPACFYAQEGSELVVPEGITLPDMSNALTLPRVSEPLREYNPDLVDPPGLVDEATEE